MNFALSQERASQGATDATVPYAVIRSDALLGCCQLTVILNNGKKRIVHCDCPLRLLFVGVVFLIAFFFSLPYGLRRQSYKTVTIFPNFLPLQRRFVVTDIENQYVTNGRFRLFLGYFLFCPAQYGLPPTKKTDKETPSAIRQL